MALVALDGPRRIGAEITSPQMPHMSIADFVRSPHSTITEATTERAHAKAGLPEPFSYDGLIKHLEDNQENTQAINKDAIAYAIQHMQAHLAQVRSASDRADINKGIETLTGLRNTLIAEANGAKIGSWFSKALKSVGNDIKKAATAVAHVATQAVQVVATAAKDVEHVVAMVSAAPARLAALALIRSNDMGLATSLAAAWNKDSDKVKGFWSGLGGDTAQLENAIKTGGGAINGAIGEHVKAHYRRTGYDGDWNTQFPVKAYNRSDREFTRITGAMGDTVGDEIATPIIQAIKDFLLALGIPIPPFVTDELEKFIAGGINKLGKGITKGTTLTTLFVPPQAKGGIVPHKAAGSFPLVPVLVVGGVGVALLASIMLND